MAVYRRMNNLLICTAALLAFLISYMVRYRRPALPSMEDARVVDIHRPPPLLNSFQEGIRLNELIAYTQYMCKNTVRVPDESHAFKLCTDNPNGISLLINPHLTFMTISNSFDDFDFEAALVKLSNGTAKGFIISPKNIDDSGNGPISGTADKITYHSGVLIPSTSLIPGDSSRKYITPLDIKNKLVSMSKLDVLKMDCTNCWNLADQPKLVSELIELDFMSKVKQLHLVVRLDENNDGGLLYSWYLVLHQLFYQTQFALYSAVQLGECGRNMIHCQYKLSFINVAGSRGGKTVLAPISGMGFPEEEVSRLLSYVRTAEKSACVLPTSITIHNSEWTLCKKASTLNTCKLYFFSYGQKFEKFLTSEFQCKVYWFDPTFEQNEISTNTVDGYNLASVTLAHKKAGSSAPGLGPSSTDWTLTTLEALKVKMKHDFVDYLLLDLNGGEFDVFEQLVKPEVSKMFGHMLIRLRIWFGEENENYRQLYSWLVTLERAGWTMFSSRSLGGTYGCPINGCFELGFIKTGESSL